MATRLLMRLKSQHNPAKQVLGLLGEKGHVEGAAGHGKRDSSGARAVCTGLDAEGTGARSVERKGRERESLSIW